MHAFKHDNVTIHHNADYGGDVLLTVHGQKGELAIPFSALKAFIASAVRQQIIAEVEQQDDDEILGVEQLGDEPEL